MSVIMADHHPRENPPESANSVTPPVSSSFPPGFPTERRKSLGEKIKDFFFNNESNDPGNTHAIPQNFSKGYMRGEGAHNNYLRTIQPGRSRVVDESLPPNSRVNNPGAGTYD